MPNETKVEAEIASLRDTHERQAITLADALESLDLAHVDTDAALTEVECLELGRRAGGWIDAAREAKALFDEAIRNLTAEASERMYERFPDGDASDSGEEYSPRDYARGA